MFLPAEKFKTVVDSTPLISIDLVVQNRQGEILLGRRNNRPAQDYWFVPGGRICKAESIANAFSRLCKEELGEAVSIEQAEYIGPFEHFYTDSVFGEDISTHYVVLGYRLMLDLDLAALPAAQHNDYAFLAKKTIEQNEQVHLHTKWYLPHVPG